MNRRDFLAKMSKRGLIMGSSLKLLPIFLSQMERAYAQTLGATFDQHFLTIHLESGHARWLYDAPLRPNSNDTFYPNPMISNFFNHETKSLEYKSHLYKGKYIPYLWSGDIPAPGGATKKMTHILDNTMMVRGINIDTTSHGTAEVRSQYPLTSADSIQSSIGGKLSAPLKVCDLSSGNMVYGTSAGLPKTVIKELFETLKIFETQTTFSITDYEEAVDSGLSIINRHLSKYDSKLQMAYETRIDTKKIFKNELLQYEQSFDVTKDKYTDLLQRSLHDDSYKIEGIDSGAFLDPAYFSDLSEAEKLLYMAYNNGGTSYITENGFTHDDVIHPTNGTISYYVNSMATMEFLVLQNIGGSIMTEFDYIRNVGYSSGHNFKSFVRGDMHDEGALHHIIFLSKFYRAIQAGVTELVDQFKSSNVFDKVMIYLSGEMSRQPNDAFKTGTTTQVPGTEHGASGNAISLISGQISKFTIAGGISHSHYKNIGDCTWGKNCGENSEGLEPVMMEEVFETITDLMEIPSVNPRAASSLIEDKSTMKVKASKEAKSVS